MLNRRRLILASLLATAGAVLTALPRRARGAAPARVVIIGGGYAGSACALALRSLAAEHEILLIDPDDPYTTCPGSNEVIAGRKPLSALQVSRAGLRRAGVLVVRDRVLAIDGERRSVLLTGGARLPYDRLVVAPGIRFLWSRIEGSGPQAALRMPHAWAGGEQTARLAAQLRAMRNGGLVVICVPAGPMRCPPGPYERTSLIAQFLRQHKPRAKLRVLDANNSFPRLPQFMRAWQEFYPGLIEWTPGTEGGAVERIDAQRMLLFTGAGTVHADVANVIPPQAPAELAPAAGLAAEHGWCPVDPRTFESRIPAVHVIGDACIAGDMPKSGSAALSQARQCAAAIAALLADRAPPAAHLESVCYARVTSALALSIPGQFLIEEGQIRSATPPPVSSAMLDEAQAPHDARSADRWYAQARAQAFAD